MFKVDNIIPLWRVVIPNMVLEPCQTKGVLYSRAPEKGVEPRLRGGYSRAP